MAVKAWSSICNIGLATAGPIDVPRFRAVFSELHDSLLEVGFVWSTKARSAQVDLVSGAYPTTPHVAEGTGDVSCFRIYELNDSLQSTAPIYIRLTFMSFNPNGVFPSVAVQVGTTCDDTTGVLGGLVTDRRFCLAASLGNVPPIFTATNHRFSRGEGYYGQVWNMNGDLDEFRVTNNVARYVANFTPPTGSPLHKEA